MAPHPPLWLLGGAGPPVSGFDLAQQPHRRFNPLTGDWIVVSPHRTRRPWQGQVEEEPDGAQPPYDPDCYLCPGNARSGGARNPSYGDTFAFDNDFPGVLPDSPSGGHDVSGLLVARSERGIPRVACFSPRHDLTLATMGADAIAKVVDMWCAQYQELGARDFIHHVAIFENRGAMMGASNPHPHGQIWATETVPDLPMREQEAQARHLAERSTCLLCEYAALELALGERLVCGNASFVALVPFWAVWPFEAMVLPRRHAMSLDALTAAERLDLADVLRRLTTRYDNLFEAPFPYSMGFHQRPTDGLLHDEWHLHGHFFPPLLRSATIRKFQVGFEMLCTPQRDITAESAAERLRALSETHYLRRASPETQADSARGATVARRESSK